jgi:alpha-amylase/alpha-mannosidase (GH57 family)
VSKKYVCIHGHFYQPPRESPWLETVEEQPSAAPMHDWNERVNAECYAPNARARILDGAGNIDRVVNNFSRISFDAGPTLLSWMEHGDPETYAAILEADAKAIAARGHGTAMAQAHGHLILPFCHARDQRTQVRWGARDFELRFQRRPKAMWLAETAVDTPSLEALADEGIEITVLAPNQCARVRHRTASGVAGKWVDVSGSRVDGRRAYHVVLPSGRRMVVFFYDGPLSRAVAFERVLDDGARFAERLKGAFEPRAREAQLVHIATDGESYGHHHRFGEMALAFALEDLASKDDPSVVGYEEFRALHPPTWEAEIVEGSSWSCAHGIERWRSDCGCSTGGMHGWNQRWRGPLREAFDLLRDAIAPRFEQMGGALFHDPWRARDAYIDVVVDPSEASRKRFLEREGKSPGLVVRGSPERVRALSLLEMQRHAMSMYTSCGWFFNDVSGIETEQCLAYAARALELATEIFGDHFEEPFLRKLAEAKSNRPEAGDARRIFETTVRPHSVSLRRAAAHFAVSSLFSEPARSDAAPSARRGEPRYGFVASFFEPEQRRAAKARLALGQLVVEHERTEARLHVDYAVVHLGDHNLGGGVRAFPGGHAHAAMRASLTDVFSRYDLTEVLRSLEKHFPGGTESIRALFHDEQKRVLASVLQATLDDALSGYARIYEQQAPLMRYLASLGQTPPEAFTLAAEITLGHALAKELRRGVDIDLVAVDALSKEAHGAGVTLSSPELGEALESSLLEIIAAMRVGGDDVLDDLGARVASLAMSGTIPFSPIRCQDALVRARDERDAHSEAFRSLARALRVRA